MTKPLIKIVDIENNEEIEREMSDSEYAEWQSEQEKFFAEKNDLMQKSEIKKSILEKLNLTEEEIKVLLG